MQPFIMFPAIGKTDELSDLDGFEACLRAAGVYFLLDDAAEISGLFFVLMFASMLIKCNRTILLFQLFLLVTSCRSHLLQMSPTFRFFAEVGGTCKGKPAPQRYFPSAPAQCEGGSRFCNPALVGLRRPNFPRPNCIS